MDSETIQMLNNTLANLVTNQEFDSSKMYLEKKLKEIYTRLDKLEQVKETKEKKVKS